MTDVYALYKKIESRIKDVLLAEYGLSVSSVEKEAGDCCIAIVPISDKTVDIPLYGQDFMEPVSFGPEGVRFRIFLGEFEERFGVIGKKSLVE